MGSSISRLVIADIPGPDAFAVGRRCDRGARKLASRVAVDRRAAWSVAGRRRTRGLWRSNRTPWSDRVRPGAARRRVGGWTAPNREQVRHPAPQRATERRLRPGLPGLSPHVRPPRTCDGRTAGITPARRVTRSHGHPAGYPMSNVPTGEASRSARSTAPTANRVVGSPCPGTEVDCIWMRSHRWLESHTQADPPAGRGGFLFDAWSQADDRSGAHRNTPITSTPSDIAVLGSGARPAAS